MILESIELKHVGPFRRTASIGPLKKGINVLAAPNERGKSTFMRAAARALFDKHSCGDDEIRALQPAGTDLPPVVTVIFETAGVRYRVEKRFINKPTSEISEWRGGAWQLLDNEDAADERLQKLLQSTVPGRGATKAAHWGLLGYLWARQGEASDWPSWDGQTGEHIQSRLAKVEIDPVIQKLKESLWEDYSALFTPNGRPKKMVNSNVSKRKGRKSRAVCAPCEKNLRNWRSWNAVSQSCHQKCCVSKAKSWNVKEKPKNCRNRRARLKHCKTNCAPGRSNLRLRQKS